MYLEKKFLITNVSDVSKSIQNHPLVAQIVLMYPTVSKRKNIWKYLEFHLTKTNRNLFWGNVLAAMATNDYSIASLVGLTAVTFSLRIFARSQRRQQ